MIRLSHIALPISVILFLFSAFYKNIIYSPVDLSIVAGALVCVCLAPWWRKFQGLKQPLVFLIFALNLYLAMRLLPTPQAWGIQKTLAALAFGIPSLFAGYVISCSKTMRRILLQSFAWLSVPLALIIVIESIPSPLDFSTIGGSGYQITGLFFAFAMIASSILANPYTMASSVIGALVCGNITGIAFGGAAVIVVWLRQWDLRAIGKQIACSLGVAILYTVLIAPPLAIQRTLLTSLGMAKRTEIVAAPSPPAPPSLGPRDTIDPATTAPQARASVPAIFKSITTNPEKLEENATTSTERIDIWKSAIERIKQKPLWGWGYGNVKYGAAAMAHNVFFEMLAEGGVIAFGLMLAIFILAFRAAWQADDSLALGFLILVSLDMMISAVWGLRISLFAFGLAAGATYQKIKSPPLPT